MRGSVNKIGREIPYKSNLMRKNKRQYFKSTNELSIKQHNKKVLKSDDGSSILMIWNNIIGVNYQNNEQGRGNHEIYIEYVVLEMGFIKGEITLYDGDKAVDTYTIK
jgi:hypothetical protein